MNVKKLKLYLLISVVLAAAYSPALFTEFMMQDDYYAFTFGPDASFFIGSVGRPIQYLIIDFLSHFSAASFKSIFFIRVLLLGAFAFFALELYSTLARGAYSRFQALSFTLFIMLTPSFNVNFAWLIVAVDITGFLACLYAFNIYWFGGNEGFLKNRKTRILISIILVAFSDMVYQMTSVIIMSLSMYFLIYSHENEIKNNISKILKLFGIMAAGHLIYFISIKAVIHFSSFDTAARLSQNMGADAAHRLLSIISKCINGNYAFHYYYWGWLSKDTVVIIGTVLMFFIVHTGFKTIRQNTAKIIKYQWLTAAFLIFSASLFFGLDSGSRELRTKPMLTMMLLFLICYGIGKVIKERKFPAFKVNRIIIAILSVSLISSIYTIHKGISFTAGTELQYIKTFLASKNLDEYDSVYMIQPEKRCYFQPCYGHFEFEAKLSTVYEWVPNAIITYSLKSIDYRNYERLNINFGHQPPESADEKTLLLDMRPLDEQFFKSYGVYKDIRTRLKEWH